MVCKILSASGLGTKILKTHGLRSLKKPFPRRLHRRYLFRPFRADSFSRLHPRLAPWAVFLRRFAAALRVVLIARCSENLARTVKCHAGAWRLCWRNAVVEGKVRCHKWLWNSGEVWAGTAVLKDGFQGLPSCWGKNDHRGWSPYLFPPAYAALKGRSSTVAPTLANSFPNLFRLASHRKQVLSCSCRPRSLTAAPEADFISHVAASLKRCPDTKRSSKWGPVSERNLVAECDSKDRRPSPPWEKWSRISRSKSPPCRARNAWQGWGTSSV